MSKPALLIIDMCQDFFREGRLLELRPSLAKATNELVAFFRKNDFPIFWIRQEFEPDLSDAFLSMRQTGTRITIKGTPGAQHLPELNFEAGDPEIIKKRYSAFYETKLDEILEKSRPSCLVLAGVNTHACIRTAAVDGFQRDYEILLADECINSYDEGFHQDSKRYLQGRVGNFVSNSEIIGKFTRK